MQKQLATIMKLRYWKYLVGLFVIIVGLQSAVGINRAYMWHKNDQYVHSKAVIKDFKRDPKPYLAEIRYTEQKNPHTLQDYQVSKTRVFETAIEPLFLIDSPITVLIILLTFTAGLMTFASDRRTHFDTYLFSLPQSRQRIYWTKIVYVVGTLLCSSVIGRGIYALILKCSIHAEYIHWHASNQFQQLVGYLILLFVIYAIGLFFGLTIGELPTLLIGAYGFLVTLMLSIPSIDFTWHILSNNDTSFSSWNGSDIILSKLLSVKYNGNMFTRASQIGLLVGLLLIGCLLLIFGNRIYRRLSLENKQDLFTLNVLKKTMGIFAVLYLAWFGTVNGILLPFPLNMSIDHQRFVLAWQFLVYLCILGVLAWLFTERPWQKRLAVNRIKS